MVFRFVEMLIFAEVIISWIMPNSNNEIVRIIRSLTEPLLAPGRKLQQRLSPDLPLDFSPFIALILLDLVKSLIISIVLR